MTWDMGLKGDAGNSRLGGLRCLLKEHLRVTTRSLNQELLRRKETGVLAPLSLPKVIQTEWSMGKKYSETTDVLVT